MARLCFVSMILVGSVAVLVTASSEKSEKSKVVLKSWQDYLAQMAQLGSELGAFELPSPGGESAAAGVTAAQPLLPASCQWQNQTVCTDAYKPVCVTNLQCIYVVRNRCRLNEMNCPCETLYALDAKFCDFFVNPNYKRCNLKLFIK